MSMEFPIVKQVFLSGRDNEWLKYIASKAGDSQAQTIRDAIGEYIAAYLKRNNIESDIPVINKPAFIMPKPGEW